MRLSAKHYRLEDYPPELHRFVRDAHLTDDPGFQQQLAEYRCSPIRLLEFLNREAEARDRLDLFDLSEGWTKTARLGDYMGFVPHGGA